MILKYIKPLVLALFLIPTINAQVGIGTTNPNATLEIVPSNQASPANTDGIIIPKIDNFPAVNPTAQQESMLVFVTGNGSPSKGFYYWDHTLTNWVPLIASGGSGGNTLDQAYDQGGNGLGRTVNATDGAMRINGEDGFLVTGSIGMGNSINAEVTGPGTRMFFNPNKGAFRAGTLIDFPPFLLGDEWDDANIGINSMAIGFNTLASGDYSTAFGSVSIASGLGSTVFGSSNTASGNSSTAFGTNSTASGAHSIVFGYEVTASQTGAIAFGNFTEASGTYATVFGYESLASGLTATAFGTDAHATGDRSIAIGVGVIASSFGETAMGTFNSTYTPNSTSLFNASDKLFVVGNGASISARSDALTIYKNGLVHITDNASVGTNTSTATLSVNGTANKPGGGTWSVFSDRRLKKNVSDYSEGLELLLKVKPVNFSYNNKMNALLGENKILSNKVFQGVIAQELQEIAPDMVREISVGTETYLEIDPNKFTYALINAVQQQQKVIEQQHKRLDALEKQLNEIKQ